MRENFSPLSRIIRVRSEILSHIFQECLEIRLTDTTMFYRDFMLKVSIYSHRVVRERK